MSYSLDKVLELAGLSSELLSRYQTHMEKQAAEQAAVDAATPGAVSALAQNERIFDNQKDDIATKIAASHAACIELITKLAAHRNASELEAIGTQVKSAGEDVRSVGAPVSDFDERPSGQKYRNMLMGAR